MLSYETGFCGCSDCNNICSSDLSVFVNSIEAASQGEKINRLMVHLRIVTLSKCQEITLSHLFLDQGRFLMKLCRLILNNEAFDVAKVDSLDGYNYSIRILKKKEGRKSNVLFIDELQLNRVIRVMKDVINKHGENSE